MQFLDDRVDCFKALDASCSSIAISCCSTRDPIIPSFCRVARSTALIVLESDVAARVVVGRSLAIACAFISPHDFAVAIVSSTPLIQVVRLDSIARAGRPRSEPAMPTWSRQRDGGRNLPLVRRTRFQHRRRGHRVAASIARAPFQITMDLMWFTRQFYILKFCNNCSLNFDRSFCVVHPTRLSVASSWLCCSVTTHFRP